MRVTWLAGLVVALVIPSAPAWAAEMHPVIPLWFNGPPGFENRKNEKEVRHYRTNGEYSVTNVHNPSLTVFLPPRDKATGTAVVLVPGGGHRELWPIHEGANEAKWLNDHGIAAFVLIYRLAREKGSPYKLDIQPLQDGQRAMRLVRSRASEWGIDPNRIGMMGFSAGGELTAMVCNHSGQGDPNAADPIDRFSAHPDFQALIYSGPLGIVAQRGSRNTPPKMVTVSKNVPPTFMAVGDKDSAARWLTRYYMELKKASVSAELHIYAKQPHGFGFRGIDRHRPVTSWIQRFVERLAVEGLLEETRQSDKPAAAFRPTRRQNE